MLIFLIPICGKAQQADSLKTKTAQSVTRVNGQVSDAIDGRPLPYINVSFERSRYTVSTDKDGRFELLAPGLFSRVTFSHVGYQSVTKSIKPGQANELQIQLQNSQTQLKEVSVRSGRAGRYRNKGNPAVELIQQVINHKPQNRMESADYLQYNQYERIGLSLYDLSPKLINGAFFRKYKFMLDTVSPITKEKETSLPVYFNEKLSQHYYRKNPEKTIQILQAEKGINIIKFIDTAGLDIYLNRLYGNTIDIYENNIFIIVKQFLSPISDHSPDFYKFFIADTIQSGTEKLIELNFTPRNKADVLFEGKLTVTMDGRYAVKSCELNVNRQSNVNFLQNLKINLDFKQGQGGRYYLTKSDVKAKFGVIRDRGISVLGERIVTYSDYQLDKPLPQSFYDGKSLQVVSNANKTDTGFWAHHRTDTLTAQQNDVYARVNRLQNMQSFKTETWIASAFFGGFADFGPVQAGPLGSFLKFNNQEGARFQLAGRTTPLFNQSVYLDGYAGFGTKDKQAKYDLSTYFSLNKTAPYRFPNDYFKITYLYDVNLPGQSFNITNAQAALQSLHTGKTDYWLYNRIFSVAYVKDFETHFSYNLSFRNWNQQAAGTLIFQQNDANSTIVHDITTSEASISLRYAPHEDILQGNVRRHTIHSPYPIINLQITHAFTGVLNSQYNYTNITANIYKRVYMSQLGFADVNLLGNMLTGKVPFPLLNIAPANQSIAYNVNDYNRMDYLEFVSDHYVGINYTQNFGGFFLNKIPLIEHLKWREFLSFKILYGGLRNENNPLFSNNLFQFPTASNGANGTYALGNTPYIEGGVGIGNIFKILRVDVIRRFNYLDHPGISPYGIKLSFHPEF